MRYKEHVLKKKHNNYRKGEICISPRHSFSVWVSQKNQGTKRNKQTCWLHCQTSFFHLPLTWIYDISQPHTKKLQGSPSEIYTNSNMQKTIMDQDWWLTSLPFVTTFDSFFISVNTVANKLIYVKIYLHTKWFKEEYGCYFKRLLLAKY